MTSNNPAAPSVTSEVFVPDQLIAGPFPMVTGQGAVLTGSAALERGTVLGQILLGTPYGTPAGGNTGNGTLTGITKGVNAKAGAYTLKATGSAAATLTDPEGNSMPAVTLNVAYSNTQLAFTWASGGTPFAANDVITITVPDVSSDNKYKKSVKTATDGSQNPNAILADDADATDGDVACAIYQTGEFNANALTYDGTWTVATLTPPLRANDLFVRTAVSNAAPT